MPENWQIGGFGLYIHWPFCASKCPYCDFNSHVATSIDQERWKRAYVSAIAHYAAQTPGRVLSSIYFGGGTPSLMQPDTVGAIIEAAQAGWSFANDIEITLEANPTSVEAGRFAGYRTAGVNRVSLGVQALDDDALRRLGRLHSVQDALSALDTARSTFDRVSFDLIYARQDQSFADWQSELNRALAFDPEHLSLYQLTIEPGTAFGDLFARNRLAGLPNEDLGADLYFLTQTLCEAQGLPAYEVSNHAKPGQESHHNMVYWRAGDWVGVGPGAHGRISHDAMRYATQTPLTPQQWLSQIEQGEVGESARDALNPGDQAAEYLMMGLRVLDGIDLTRYESFGGKRIKRNVINALKESDLIDMDDNELRVTAQGRPLLNAIIRELMPD